jgi:hypothetical protein
MVQSLSVSSAKRCNAPKLGDLNLAKVWTLQSILMVYQKFREYFKKKWQKISNLLFINLKFLVKIF